MIYGKYGYGFKNRWQRPAVKSIQRMLNKLGGNLNIDGQFGHYTERSVINFQKTNHLLPDGIVGNKTWKALKFADARFSVTYKTLTLGNIGKEVGIFQKKLIGLGFSLPKFGADSAFGRETRNAVLQFQRAVGIAQDGVVGKITWEYLNNTSKITQVDKSAWAAKLKNLLDKQVGKPYIFGYEVNLDDPDPKAFDCSELVQWAFHQVGKKLPDGSWNQYAATKPTTVPTIGCLGFLRYANGRVHHVGIYCGNYVIEARGKIWGVVKTSTPKFKVKSGFTGWRSI